MTGFEIYSILRALAYLAVGVIGYSRKIYPVTVLMSALAYAAISPEVIDIPLVQASLKYVIPMAALWIGWDIIHNSNRRP